MSETDTMECPNCGELVSGGAICEECGQEFAKASETQGGTEPDFARDDSDSASFTPSEAREGPSGAAAPPADSPLAGDAAPTLDPDAPELLSLDEARKEENECSEFLLEYNIAKVFFVGQVSAFTLRLYARNRGALECRNIVIEIDCPHEDKRLRRSIHIKPRLQHPTPVNINFQPELPGVEIDSEVTLSYTLNDRLYRWHGSFLWDCASAEETSEKKLIENLVVDLKGNHNDLAADQNINILQNLRSDRSLSPLERLNQLKLKPIWRPLPLFPEVSGKTTTPKRSPAAKPNTPVTLTGKDCQTVHILPPDDTVLGRQFGRILINAYDADGYCDRRQTQRISGGHCTIAFDQGRFLIRDGSESPDSGKHKQSGNGTILNDRQVPSDTAIPIPWQQDQILGLAARVDKTKPAFSFSLSAHPNPNSDPRDSKQGCVILRQSHNPNEVFVLLAGICSSSNLPELGSRCQLRNRDGLFFVEAQDEEHPIAPGEKFRLGAKFWNCLEYAQPEHSRKLRNQANQP